ncbi:3',5'-cyclic adenosine monophosphate phosphodiesterase CpdA [Thalassocella blandensis]|nr:3',5'-cyclic adenosine monophosphate phosphodiesterase CpdA [Thalassocella blandensis]
MKSTIKILVVSDLHAVIGDGISDDSRLLFIDGSSEYGDGFIKYAKSVAKDLDLLICSGDISNKGNTESFKQGWLFLNKVKAELNIKNMLCVPGNHDHQSRKTNGVFDPKHHLQFITPPFPFEQENLNTHFWSWHWSHSSNESDSFNAISLNTSAYHGYGDEFQYGRIATEVVDQIHTYICSDSFPKRDFNLLVCHHHPEKMDYVDTNYDSEAMEGGSYLIRKIDEVDKGPWLIIHGHKHFPDIVHSRSAKTFGPVIFSAGSMSAKIYPPNKLKTSNQFYIIEVDIIKTSEQGSLAGTFRSYEWNYSDGWKPSGRECLPSEGGFGSIVPPKILASKILNEINDDTPFLDTNDLTKFENDLKYLTPSDLKDLISKIDESDFKVLLENNKIVQIGRKA